MARRKRHTGELYDAIWEGALPEVPRVADHAVRLVLMAMAKHTNPARDAGAYRCWMTVGTIAQLVNISERQVQRVLTTLYQDEWLAIEHFGQRAGRNRASQPCVWRLLPETWPRRAMAATPGTDGDDAGVATNGMVTTPGAMVATPASPKPINRTHKDVEPVKELSRTRVREADALTDIECPGCLGLITRDGYKTQHRGPCGFAGYSPALIAARMS